MSRMLLILAKKDSPPARRARARRLLSIFLLFLLLGFEVLPAAAQTHHVSVNGNDSNPGTVGGPLRNILTALIRAAEDDTIKVAEGTYSEGVISQTRVVLLGGYSNSFTESERDIFANRSIIRAVSVTMFTDLHGYAFDGFFLDGNTVAEIGVDLQAASVVTHNVIVRVNQGSGHGAEISDDAFFVNNTVHMTGQTVRIFGGQSASAVVKNNILSQSGFGINNLAANDVHRYNDVVGNVFNYGGFFDFPGIGDISLDPKFVDPGADDFRVKNTSPTIDAGDPADPVGEEPDPHGGRINMGAYGGTRNATSGPEDTFVVNVTGDASDANLGDEVCETATPGECTLRAAIEQANAQADADVIEFDIPGSGVHTIQPGSALPDITQPLTIDGYTQPGAMPNTLDVGSNAVLLIELDGTDAGDDVDGLQITGAGSIIRGLVINRFDGEGIDLPVSGSINNVIEGTFIGTDAAGTSALSNAKNGVALSGGAQGNVIGGTITSARNVLSGNKLSGVGVFGSGTQNNRIQGNYIGINAAGTAKLGNLLQGIAILNSAASNVVGGSSTDERNVISGNDQNGVRIDGAGTTGNQVQGNYIGTDATGSVALGNSRNGVFILNMATANLVGGSGSDESNIISGNHANGIRIAVSGTTGNRVEGNYIGTDVSGMAVLGNEKDGVAIAEGARDNIIGGVEVSTRNIISGNRENGVRLADTGSTGNRIEGNTISLNGQKGVILFSSVGTGNAIVGNSIFQNGSLGIDLGGDGMTANDADDADAGPNNLQNFPSLTTAEINGSGDLFLTYNVDTDPVNATYPLTIEFFVADNDDEEGQTLLGSDTYTAADFTTGSKQIILDDVVGLGVSEGTFLVATATDADGNTSEFSFPAIAVQNRSGSVITVNSTADNTTGGDGACTLREAITNANNDNDTTSGDCTAGRSIDTIAFNIPGERPRTIRLLGALPTITQPVTIDGYTQPGASENTLTEGSDAVLVIELDGDLAGVGDGLKITGANSTIRGLVINRFNGSGINLSGTGSTGNVIAGNYIGTNIDGTAALGNGEDGVLIASGASDNIIGGTAAEARNVISGNDDDGIFIEDSGTTGNRVEGNYIGTNASGTASLGNSDTGVLVMSGASDNTVGGMTPGAGNVISGNRRDGVAIARSGTADNLVQGNFIGTDATGTADLGNSGTGVVIFAQATNNTIGGTTAGARNVISGNNDDGVQIQGNGTTGNVVQGNYIGPDVTGTEDLGNGDDGVCILQGASGNTIGGTAAEARNVISGNEEDGIVIRDNGTTGNRVEGNFIGTDATGTTALGNRFQGVFIHNGASSNTIGGTAANAGNIIAFNTDSGVVLAADAATDNAILGNSIFQNGSLGIDLGNDGATPNDPGDVDTGPNNLQNFPDLSTAVIDGSGNLLVTYAIDSGPANAAYPLTIEFFLADVDDEEGQTFVARDTYATAQVQQASNLGMAADLGVTEGNSLVATTTDAENNTSEFSPGVIVGDGSNRSPEVENPIADQQLEPGGAAFNADLNSVFADADGDALAFSALSSNAAAAPVSVSGATLTVTPQAAGTAMITVTADDGRGGQVQTSFDVVVYPATLAYNVSRSFGDATQQVNYRLVGLPGAIGLAMASTLSGTPGDDWRAFRDTGSEGADSLAEFNGSSAFNFRPGQGFWLLSRQPWASAQTLATVALSTDGAASISIHDGWNILSNPFDQAVTWTEVLAVNGLANTKLLFRWNGSFSQTATFTSAATNGEAFYYFNDTGLSQLKLPYPGIASIPETTPLPAPSRVLTVSAYVEGALASSVQVGMAEAAEAGLDAYDQVAPPGYFEAARLRLVSEEEGASGRALAAEYKPEGEEGYVFDLVLRAPEEASVTLVVEGLDAFAGRAVYLVDRARSKAYDLREHATLPMAVSPEPSRYRLVIGTQAFVEDATDELVPETIALLPNYPNPFNPSTIIEYALPASVAGEAVRLEIYDVVGRRVRLLVDARQEAGFYRVTWNGADGAGTPVASGVYLYRLQAGRFSQVRRMLLVK